MKIDKVIGDNAGKIWLILRKHGPLTASKISSITKIKLIDVYSGLGWLAREGKIESEKKSWYTVYKLIG